MLTSHLSQDNIHSQGLEYWQSHASYSITNMAPAKSTASPTPGPSVTTKDLRAMTIALYNWCRITYDADHILSQGDLLAGDIIPNKDLSLLLKATQSLINDRLFRTHDLRSGGIGWKIVSHVSADKYKDLSSDESLVYSVIESTGIGGAWVKTIKNKLNLHQKNVDQSIKTLIQRGYIKAMSTVKYPNRKMYILAALQPGEDATGGAWFTDGVLDYDLMETLATILLRRISELSWKQVIDVEESSGGSGNNVSRKRKEPDDGFDSASKGKEKMRRDNNEAIGEAKFGSSGAEGDDHHEPPHRKHHGNSKRSKKTYVPFPAGYQKYPTLKDLTKYVNDNDFLQSGNIPENNISQLLDVMVYDDRIIKVKPSPDDSAPTMFKSRKDVGQVAAEIALEGRMREKGHDEAIREKLFREIEISILGNGGITEIPCGRCPVFDMCEIGGPVNPNNCKYFEEWFVKLESRKDGGDEGLAW